MMNASAIISGLERQYVTKLMNQGKRMDGRGLLEYRKITIISNFIPKAEGSADVRIGNTRVICGIKYDIGKPYSDNPDKGVCTVMAEFVPIASPLFEPGRPGENAIQLARVVDLGIRHTDCLDYNKLCVAVGKYVYVIFVDNYTFDHYGNLTDTAALAAITALLGAKLPRAKLNDEGEPVWDGTYMNMPINEIPLSITFGKIGDTIFVDPIFAEEMVMDGSIAFAIDEKKQITSIQKYGSATWSVSEILETGKKAVKIADDLRAKLNLRQYIPKLD